MSNLLNGIALRVPEGVTNAATADPRDHANNRARRHHWRDGLGCQNALAIRDHEADGKRASRFFHEKHRAPRGVRC